MAERRPRSLGLAKGLLLSGLMTLVMLGVLELFVRAFVPVRQVGPAFSVHDPVLGKRLRPSFTATRVSPEFEFTIETNSLGMRDPEPTGPLTGGVVFLGDSFTLGYGVEQDEAFPALLRQRLHAVGVRVPVLNMGIGNAGNGRWLKLLESEVPAYQPEVIVLQLLSNDFSDNLRERLYELDPKGKLVARPIPPPGWARAIQTAVDAVPGLSHSFLVGLASQAVGGQSLSFRARPAVPPSMQQETDGLTYALVGAAVRRARALGARVLVLLVHVQGHRRGRIAEIVEPLGASLVDAPPKTDAPELYYEIDGHWNARGHREAAELLAPAILEALR